MASPQVRPGIARYCARPIKPAAAGNWLEALGQSYHRLGGAEHEISITTHDPRQAIEHTALRLLVKIEQHVAAEHHIEYPEMGEIADQVEPSELDHGADAGRDLPIVIGLREILEQKGDRQPALHFELAVDPRPCALQHLAAKIRCNDLD